MTKSVFLLILTNVFMTSMAQIVLKAGMSSPAILQSMVDGPRWSSIPWIASSPLVVLGLAMYFGAALIWLVVLSKIEVSLAYPFVGMGFIITMLFGWMFFGDSMSAARIGGTVMIAIGVAVLARS